MLWTFATWKRWVGELHTDDLQHILVVLTVKPVWHLSVFYSNYCYKTDVRNDIPYDTDIPIVP